MRHYGRSVDAPALEVSCQVGKGPEQPSLVKGAPAHGRGLEADNL